MSGRTIKERIKQFNDGLDQHVKRRVEQVLENRIREYFEGLLVQKLHEFMDKRLDEHIQAMIRNNLDAALEELYSEFDLGPYEGGKTEADEAFSSTSQPQEEERPVIRTEPETEKTRETTKSTFDLTEDQRAFLAYCQYYEKYTGQFPPNERLHRTFKEFGNRVATIRRELRDKDWITQNIGLGEKESGSQPIQYKVIKRLPDECEVLKVYFDNENQWRLQEDPNYE